jgi:hypothetical protein
MSADSKPKWQAHRSVELEIIDPGGPQPPSGDSKIGANPLASNQRVDECPALTWVASLGGGEATGLITSADLRSFRYSHQRRCCIYRNLARL